MFTLADSPWPRTGGDRGNRSNSPLSGPTAGRLAHQVSLTSAGLQGPAAVIVSSDGSLRVTCGGTLFGVDIGGKVPWGLPLGECHSAPVALEDGRTLLASREFLLVVDSEGRKELVIPCGFHSDDSGPSPNISWENEPILTSPMGEVRILRGGEWHQIGVFGYDVLPPALYPDGTLAISGYYGKGFCRVQPSGKFVFRSGLKEADLLPSINAELVAAVGSLNQDRSCFFDQEGRELGSYPSACVFADYAGAWVALERQGFLSLLTSQGETLWRRELPLVSDWGLCQPVVDAAGRTYATVEGGVAALDPQGKLLFLLQAGAEQAGPPAIVRPGLLAMVVGQRLLFIE